MIHPCKGPCERSECHDGCAHPPLNSSYEWLNSRLPAKRVRIVDPDGWDRSSAANLMSSMEEPITEAEFERRLRLSTITQKR